MNKSARWPLLNPLRFTPIDGIIVKHFDYKIINEALNAKYNTYGVDNGLFWQQIREFYQGPAPYARKLQKGDSFSIYHDSLSSGAYFTIVDDKGVLAYGPSVGIPLDYSVIGNTDPDFIEQYNTHDTVLDFGASSFPTGIYYVIVEDRYSGDPADSVYFISEPIHYRNKEHSFPRTMLFEFDNLTNDYDVLFETYKQGSSPQLQMNLRCEAVIDEIDPAFHDTAWEDQGYAVQKSSSTPYRLFQLTVFGVPGWMIDKVNRILSCDIVAIDGMYYRKDINANWSFAKVPGNALKTGTINLREAYPDRAGVYPNPPIPFEGFRIFDDQFDEVFD